MKRKLVSFWPYIIILFASLIPFILNVSIPDPGGMFNLRDSNTLFDPASDIRAMLYTWLPNWGFGYPNLGAYLIPVYHFPLYILRQIFQLSLINTERVYLTSILFLLGFGAYFFLSKSFSLENHKNKKIAAVFGALFYMFNIPTNQRFIGVPHTAISISLFPIILILVRNILLSHSFGRTLRYCLVLSLLSPIFYGSDPSLAYLFSLFILIYGFLVLILRKKQVNYKNLALGSIVTVIFSLILNAFWLLPIVASPLSKSFYAGTVGSSYNVDTFERSAATINSPLDIVRLHWTKNSFDVVSLTGENYYPAFIGNYYRLPFSYILFLLLIILGLRFSLKDKNNKNEVLIFSAIGLLALFFSLGRYAPFGFWSFHQFLFFNFPGFMVLRTFSKFQFVLVFWYVILLFFVAYNFWNWTRKSKRRKILIIFTFVIFIFQGALPWFWPNLAGRLEFFKLPDYYQNVKNWLDNEKGYFRFLVFPQGKWEETYDWGPKYELIPLYKNYFKQPSLYSEPVDATGTKSYFSPIESFLPKNPSRYLQFFNVKYVLLRKDLRKINAEREYLFEEDVEKYLVDNNFRLVKNYNNNLKFYKSDGVLLPQIYIPKEIYYLDSDAHNFYSAIEERSNSGSFATVKTDHLNDSIREFWLVEESEKCSEFDCFFHFVQFSKDQKNSNIYVKHKPGSLLYHLVLFKEWFGELRVRNDKIELLEKKFDFASKRIMELESYWPLEGEVSRVLYDRYWRKIKEITGVINKLDNELKYKGENQYRINLTDHYEKVSNLAENSGRDDLVLFADKIADELEELRDKRKDIANFEYTFHLPVEGKWQILIDNNFLTKNSRLKVDGKEIIILPGNVGNAGGWTKLAETELQNLDFKVNFSLGNDHGDFVPEWKKINAETYIQPIKNWQKRAKYWLRFDYEGQPKSFEIGLTKDQAAGQSNQNTLETEKLVVEKGINKNSLTFKRSYEAFFELDGNVQSPSLYFTSKDADPSAIKNLKLIRIVNPKMALRLIGQSREANKIIPKIVFQEMNPTKFRVTVDGANGPYLLVFNESFHQGWNAIIRGASGEKGNLSGEELSYFDGEVKEKEPANDFWNGILVKDGGKIIPKERHIVANGFANGWIVLPADSEGKQTYEIDIVFSPQRVFMLSSLVSLVFFLGAFFCAVGLFVRNKYINR